jgi:hypothetical protein
MEPKVEDSELEARLGKRFFKLCKTLEIYGENGSVRDTARILGLTQKTVEKRLAVAGQEFENAKKFLKEIDTNMSFSKKKRVTVKE